MRVDTAIIRRGSFMPKALCIISLVVAVLVFVVFFLDLLLRLFGMSNFAPLQGASLVMDVAYSAFGAILIYLAWTTYREQLR